MTDEELKTAIREARPAFEARVASGEIVVRKLTYVKKGPSISGVVETEKGLKELVQETLSAYPEVAL